MIETEVDNCDCIAILNDLTYLRVWINGKCQWVLINL